MTKYTGELAHRLRSLDAWMDAAKTEEELNRVLDADFDRKHRKMMQLLELHGIVAGKSDRDVAIAFYLLARRLAETHVPGLKVANAPGRPRVWNTDLRLKAAIAIAELAAEYPKENHTKLAARLLLDPAWSRLSKTPGALLRQMRMLNGPGATKELAGIGRLLFPKDPMREGVDDGGSN
jgi:hypothetical protein